MTDSHVQLSPARDILHTPGVSRQLSIESRGAQGVSAFMAYMPATIGRSTISLSHSTSLSEDPVKTAATFPWSSVRKLMVTVVAIVLGAIASLQAQNIDPRIGGTTYVIAFPDTVGNAYDVRQDSDPRFTRREPQSDSVFATIYSPTDNVVSITGNGGYAKQFMMKGGEITTIWLNGNPRAATPICNDIGGISTKTFRITAVSPVVAYCFMGTKFGTEAFTPIPVEHWGMSYYTAALPGEILYDETAGTPTRFGSSPKAGPSEILIVAAFDNTRVTITPNGRLFRTALTTVTLMKDQCYQVQSYVNIGDTLAAQDDLGGSLISANKPIGVISGNTRGQVIDNHGGLLKNSFKNLMIEWLAPVELHGTEFVYLPTWDRWRPTGNAGENPDQVRPAEVVRVYGTTGKPSDTLLTVTNGVEIDGGTGAVDSFQVRVKGFHASSIAVPAPHVFRTDKPAQAFMNTAAVVRFNGTTGNSPSIGYSYDGVATYMAQLMPREYWSYTAPFIAPLHPAKMEHFLNIVTDSNSRKRITIDGKPVTIDRMIAGTDLYWGSRTLTAGEQGVIQGADSSCKFYAVIYGEELGMEVFRPGRTRKGGDGGATGGTALFSSEYEENIGFMYGYPVASSYQKFVPPPPPVVPDSLQIDTIYNCGLMIVKVREINQHPTGLRSIELELDSTVNARLMFVDPAPPEPVNGLTRAEVDISPIDSSKAAHGIVVIQDRTGKTWNVYYRYTPEYIRIDSTNGIDFGVVNVNTTKSLEARITNPMPTPILIRNANLGIIDPSLRIDSTRPALPALLPPGDTMVVYLSFTPLIDNKVYEDTLVITRLCGIDKIPLLGATVQPCLYIDDFVFGTVPPGTPVPLEIDICNRGGGTVTFHDSAITWNLPEFTITDTDRARLRNAVLGPGECVTITITFVSDSVGMYQDIAALHANTSECRDSSYWSARVSKEAGVAISGSGGGYAFGTIGPNPLSSSATISFRLGAGGRASVEIFDALGNRVATLADGMLDGGDHSLTWNTGDLPAGMYYCRIRSGSWNLTRPMMLMR